MADCFLLPVETNLFEGWADSEGVVDDEGSLEGSGGCA